MNVWKEDQEVEKMDVDLCISCVSSILDSPSRVTSKPSLRTPTFNLGAPFGNLHNPLMHADHRPQKTE